jgi:hypothetical protein
VVAELAGAIGAALFLQLMHGHVAGGNIRSQYRAAIVDRSSWKSSSP